MSNLCPNINSPEWQALENAVGRFEAMRAWMENNYEIPPVSSVVKSNVNAHTVNYSFKVVDFILSDIKKISKLESQLPEDVFWNKLQKDYQIPKDQVNLLRDQPGSNINDKLVNFISTFSYAVEVNTAKDESVLADMRFEGELPNTDYYRGMTVPGGIKYTENEIATPAITPSIKGHAQFATDKGIGWFRSDELLNNQRDLEFAKNEWSKKDYEKYLNESKTKTRRILEVQSDLFQKGRDKKLLISDAKVRAKHRQIGENLYGLTDAELSEELKEQQRLQDEVDNANENKFLQLLNKDNNWVTFFIKSIIQDSLSKGYEKVLFPTGNTASKVEGHTTLEEFKKQKEDRIKELEEKKKKNTANINDFLSMDEQVELLGADFSKELPKNYIEDKINNEIAQLKKELERVEREGFAALRPIYNFYENTVTNILKKNYTINQITDEYGNTWNEVALNQDKIIFNNVISFYRDASIYDPKFSVLEDPITLKPEETSQTRGNEILEALVDRLKQNLGIDVQFVTEEEAAEIIGNSGGIYSDEPGFFLGGTVYLIKNRVNSEIVFHEFSHALIRAISKDNPTLFSSLFTKLSLTPEGIEIINQVQKLYPEFSPSDSLFKEECIVRALTLAAKNSNFGATESTGFKKWLQDLFYAIKQMLRALFKGSKIKVEKLNSSTTLNELANMLLSEQFKLSKESISQADVAAFIRGTREELLDSLENIERKDLNNITTKFAEAASNMQNLVNNVSFKELREVLKDPMGRSDIKEIMSNLQDFKNISGMSFDSPEKEIEFANRQAANVLNSLIRLDKMADKILKHYAKLSEDVDNKENLAKIMYYNTFIKEWMVFLSSAKSSLLTKQYEGHIQSDNPIVQLIDGITTTFERTKKYAEKVAFEGTSEILMSELEYMKENIDSMYKNLLETYERKKAPQGLIDLYKAEYEKVKLTPEKIKALLKGNLGDADPINSFVEGYMHNQDPIVFGFAKYVKNHYTEMVAKVQSQINDFSSEVESLLNSAGYKTAYDRIKTMGDDLLFIDNKKYDKEGNLVSYYTFLNPWKEFEADRDKLEKAFESAKQRKIEEGTQEALDAYNKALEDLKEFNKNMHQEYTPEYYKRFELLTKDEIGKEADRRMKKIINEIQMLQTNLTSVDQLIENKKVIAAKWREYRRLSSLVYADGTKKTGLELDIAERIQEYKQMSRELNSWHPRQGLFENSYKNYIQSLLDRGVVKGTEYDELVDKWIIDNTVARPTDEYFDLRASLFAELMAINEEDPDSDKTAQLYSDLNNIISGYRDEDGQPLGSEMSDSMKKAIVEIEREIEKIYNNGLDTLGITPGDWAAFNYYEDTIAKDPTGSGLSDEEWEDYERIKKMLKGRKGRKGKSAAQMDLVFRKQKILTQLKDLSEKVPTDDYVDTVNELLTEEMREFLLKKIGTSEFSKSDIGFAYSDEFVKFASDSSKEFAEWFKNNHLSKTYKKKRKSITYHKPSRAWTTTVPKDSSYLQKTIILDDNNNVIAEVPGVPNISYFYRQVNPEYITKKKTMLDCIEEGLPLDQATVDMKGRFLPRWDAQDQKYFNQEFYDLQKTSPAKYKLLLTLIKNHLTYQKASARDSRLNLEIPRYRKDNLETISSGQGKSLFTSNPIVVWFKQVKSIFGKRADDFERGLNPDEMNTLVKADLFDEKYSKVPVTGLYDLEKDLTSKDIMRSMMRYMQSTVKQKTLIDMLPVARSLQSLVQNPENNPDRVVEGMKQFSKRRLNVNNLLNFGSVKAQSVRAQAINAFIEREFEGKSQAGLIKDYPGINKFTNGLFGLSSVSFFAFNIPSALKNSFGMRFQSMIEAAGGRYFGWSDYMKGSAWAAKSTMEISLNLYSMQPKSVDVQLIELMDPLQGRFESKVKQGAGTTRNLLSDSAELNFTTNVRKWTELNATLSTFGAMLSKVLVEQVQPDGSITKMTYDKAWEVVDGKIQLKKGIDKKYNKDGAFFKSFVSKVHGVVNNLNGAYAQMDQPNANRYLLYRFIMFMKNYFVPMFMNRFAFRWDPVSKRFLPRYNANLEGMSKGFYIEFLQLIARTFREKGKNLAFMNDEEKYATKKTMTEVLLLVFIQQLLVNLLFGWDPDDEDRYEKLRDKSGSLPLPFVVEDENHPFKLDGWFSNHALNLALQVKDENDSWLPFPGLGLKDYVKMLSFESISLNATLGTYQRLAEQLAAIVDYNLTGDTSALYKRAVGPYQWQQEGGFKFINYLAQMSTFSGTTVDPILNIKRLQNRQTRN